jgi:hypothetical protein
MFTTAGIAVCAMAALADSALHAGIDVVAKTVVSNAANANVTMVCACTPPAMITGMLAASLQIVLMMLPLVSSFHLALRAS